MVVGVWLILGPQLPIMAIGLSSNLDRLLIGPDGFGPEYMPFVDLASTFFMVIVLCGFIALYGAVLAKVTKNYIAR